MFLSTFINKLDKKGRVSVPATFRSALAGQSFQGLIAYRSYTSAAIEACGVSMMHQLISSVDDMDLFSEERLDISSTVFADCDQLSFDSEGRINLTDTLIQHAGIAERVAFVGCGSTFQIWDPEAFTRYREEARKRLQARGFTLTVNGRVNALKEKG